MLQRIIVISPNTQFLNRLHTTKNQSERPPDEVLNNRFSGHDNSPSPPATPLCAHKTPTKGHNSRPATIYDSPARSHPRRQKTAPRSQDTSSDICPSRLHYALAMRRWGYYPPFRHYIRLSFVQINDICKTESIAHRERPHNGARSAPNPKIKRNY